MKTFNENILLGGFLIASLVLMVTAGCASYSPQQIPNNTEISEPGWVQRGSGISGEHKTKQFVAVGRAWEDPGYEKRRKSAIEKARNELANTLRGYLGKVARALARKSDIEWKTSPAQTEEFLNMIARKLVQKQTSSADIDKLYESIIRHEICALIKVPVHRVMREYLHAIMRAVTRNPGEFLGPATTTQRIKVKIKQTLSGLSV